MLNRGDILKQLLDMPPDALDDREKALNALLKNFRKISLQMHPDRIAGKSEDEKKQINELFKEVTNVKACLEEALKNGSSAEGKILKTLGVCRTAYEESDSESKAALQTLFQTAGFDDRFFKMGFMDPPAGTPQQTRKQSSSFRERNATGPGLNEEDSKFFSNINREQAEHFLKTNLQGSFIIRPSSRGSQFLAGSIKLSNTEIVHFLFEKRGNQFYLENNKPVEGSISDFLRKQYRAHEQSSSFRERSATGPGLNEEDSKSFSDINREQAEDFLKTNLQGSFIIRPSSRGSQFVAGSIRLSDTEISHFLFEKRGNQFYLENNKPVEGSISDFLRNKFRHEVAKQVREVASPSTLKNFRGELNKTEIKNAENQLKRGEYFINIAENGSVMMHMRGFNGELEAHRIKFKENYLIEPDINRYLEKSRKNFAEGKYRHIDQSEASAYLKNKQAGDFVLTRAKEDDKTIIATMKLGENKFVQERFSLDRGQLYHQTPDNKLMAVRTLSAFMEKIFVDNLAKQEAALAKRHNRQDILDKPKVDEKLTQKMQAKVIVALNKILTSPDMKEPKGQEKPITPTPRNRSR